MSAVTNGSYPARLDIQAPLEVKNWRPLVHWILAVPHLIILYALRVVRSALTLVALFTVLFTKQIPQGIFDMIVMARRYSWRVSTYVLFMREPYPPFSFTLTPQDDGIDPASLSVDYPVELQRFAPLYKWILAIPHYIVLLFLYLGACVVVLIGFFAVLFTGKWPQGLRDYLVGVSAWSLRVAAYAGLLRDEYPPFSLQVDTTPGPTSGAAWRSSGEVPPPPASTGTPPVPPPPPPA